MIDLTRAMGIICMNESLIVRAHPQDENKTAIEIAVDILVGAFVRDPETKRWRYDDELRKKLGIKENPEFETDLKAGNALRDYLPPPDEILGIVRKLNEKTS